MLHGAELAWDNAYIYLEVPTLASKIERDVPRGVSGWALCNQITVSRKEISVKIKCQNKEEKIKNMVV